MTALSTARTVDTSTRLAYGPRAERAETELCLGMEAAAAAAAAPETEEGRGEEEEAEWAWSWGAGTDGQLGNGGFDDHHLPQPLLLPTRCRGRVSLVAGGGAHAIALTSTLGYIFELPP